MDIYTELQTPHTILSALFSVFVLFKYLRHSNMVTKWSEFQLLLECGTNTLACNTKNIYRLSQKHEPCSKQIYKICKNKRDCLGQIFMEAGQKKRPKHKTYAAMFNNPRASPQCFSLC